MSRLRIDYNLGMTTYVQPSDPTAVMGRRIFAYIIDIAILIAAAFLAAGLGDWESEEFGSTNEAEQVCEDLRDNGVSFCANVNETVFATDGGSDIALFYGLPSAVSILNLVILQGVSGASIGKHLTGLRVVRQDTFLKAGIGKNALRWLLLIIDGFCCIVGLIVALSSDRHRRVGDMAANTLVVGKGSVGQPPQAAYGGTPWASAAPPPTWDPSGATQTWSPGAPPTSWDPSAPTTPPPPDAAGAAWSPPSGPAAAPPAAGGWTPPDAPSPASGPPPGFPVPGAASGPPPAPAPAPGVATPVWDDARNTYIQWDPELNAWMMWDDIRKGWVPISQ